MKKKKICINLFGYQKDPKLQKTVCLCSASINDVELLFNSDDVDTRLSIYKDWQGQERGMICWDNNIGDYAYFEKCPNRDYSEFKSYKDFFVPCKNHFERFYSKEEKNNIKCDYSHPYYFLDTKSFEMKPISIAKEYCLPCAYVQVDINEEAYEMGGTFSRLLPYEGPCHYVWRRVASYERGFYGPDEAVFVWRSFDGSLYKESPITGELEPFHLISPDPDSDSYYGF